MRVEFRALESCDKENSLRDDDFADNVKRLRKQLTI